MESMNEEQREKEEERLEKKAEDCVFTISASDYVASFYGKLSNYYFKGVEAYDERAERHKIGTDYPPILSAMGGLAAVCEELGAEAIVDVKPAVFPAQSGNYAPGDRVYLIGTALIHVNKGASKSKR